ncbi:antirestriction protein ArdA [uncultured Roseibium sp.]|uniref:antirestriction protein ArdA n=1 Tax=uncultured Roseibium sp. TaxID=1936171 RepID=UPI002608E38E|nr:antirestriction protein ArdA [uncultured Roseibium sp.]
MTVTFYAQPQNISATGFYFTDEASYREKINSITDDYGDKVEEFEIQFINGFVLDSKLAQAINPTQYNIIAMMDAMATWTEEQKLKVVIAVHEGGARFDITADDPDDIEIDLYPDMTLKDLAYQFVDEGLFGDIPKHLTNYIDYDAIADDLRHDYDEVSICGDSYVYRLA